MAEPSRESIMLKEIPVLDEVLGAHAAELGGDFTAYRNHAYRVVNLCVALSPGDPARLEKIATAAAFHDLGIWTDRTFDYLEPSVRLASGYLLDTGRPEWVPDVSAAILVHHKVSSYRGDGAPFVEAFRRADWMDVTAGVVSLGLPRTALHSVVATWPRAGFHAMLLRLQLRRLRTHPWSPLPMLKL